ncbi:MAG: CDP-glucose 4,6-dehydratase [Fibrobacteres bacterium]|nr:CDP-glucose 4,6-dehydratase [Fibrobacterota bacterium]
MEDLVNPAFWGGRRVLLTGHTGFKGSWLTLWLRSLGAEVTGYSAPRLSTDPNLFTLAGVAADCRDMRGDIADPERLRQTMEGSRPEIVFHLAAQPLVRESYRIPQETWRVNIMGTLELLQACRACDSVRAIVVVTTDKVYENAERGMPFPEGDPLGGYDPYSSSKAACEILCASWRRSFFSADSGSKTGLATARAGNVIGGGDFSADRLIPDLVRARISDRKAKLRYPQAVRPWQHVLESLSGYLLLAERLHGNAADFSRAFNFGPLESDVRPVGDVADAICKSIGASWELENALQPHEAGVLRLDSGLAKKALSWGPRLRFGEMLQWTCDWYQGWQRGADLRALTLDQIGRYQTLPSLGNPE